MILKPPLKPKFLKNHYTSGIKPIKKQTDALYQSGSFYMETLHNFYTIAYPKPCNR